MSPVALVILGMTVVTYVPRLLPLVLRQRAQTPPWVTRTLQLLPFTAIGALLIPDGLKAVSGDVLLSVIGLAVAALATWLTRQPFIAVVGAVLSVAVAQVVF